MQTFYMMVGLLGSGKSFTAKTLPNVVIHSSDAIRAEILGDENRQDQQDLVFQTLHERVLRDLAAGVDVVYDATNLDYRRRMGSVQRVDSMSLPDLHKVCVFMAPPYEKCLIRNQSRERFVPESVIDRMYKKIDIPMIAEGWDEIKIMGDEDRYKELLPLLARLSEMKHDNPHHTYTVGQHSLAAWMYLMQNHQLDDTDAMNRATLLHDIGKGKTKVFHDTKGSQTDIAHFYNHERVGAYDSFCFTTNLSHDDRLLVALLIRWHMWPYVVEKSDNPSKTANKVRRLVGEDIWNQIMVLHDCDLHAH